METRIRARIDGEWIRCGGCSHKLARMMNCLNGNDSMVLEVKCHSCKTLNILDSKMKGGE